MSTSPVALPKMLEHASFRKGFTSLPKVEGLRYTPNSSSIFFTLLSCSPRICAASYYVLYSWHNTCRDSMDINVAPGLELLSLGNQTQMGQIMTEPALD